MKKIFITTCALFMLFSTNSSPSYAIDPFSEDEVLVITDPTNQETIQEIETAKVTTTNEKKDEEKKDSGEYPCEGTINCKYGQYCRTSPWGDIVTIIPPGTKVTITGKEGDWYTTEYNGKKCYLHYSLVDTPTTPARDGVHPYAYADVNPNYKKDNNKKDNNKKDTNKNKTKNNNKVKDSSKKNNDSSKTINNKKIDTTKDINGPEVPESLMKGLDAAKKSQWNVSNKCLQFSGTIAENAGAKVSYKGAGSQPQIAWAKTKDTSLRGQKIMSLKDAAINGKLLPGMLIHVRVHYNEDPDYNRPDDGHHWFMYMGMVDGEPMFVDNIKENKLRNTEAQAQTFNVSQKYGERRITAIYDPFADQR